MRDSEILNEKHRIQTKLSSESTSIHDYFVRSHVAAEEIAGSYGFRLKYVEVSDNTTKKFTKLA